MRRLLIALTVFASSSLLLGCEDGPNQPFSPAAANAGDRWNDGQPPPAVDSATQGFGVDAGGNNKQLICTGAQLAARWAVMVKEPIKPPRFGAGLDLAGGDTWPGLLISDAEKINCQSENDGDEFGDGSQVNQWGDNGEVWVDYSVTTRKIGFMSFFPGYVGPLSLTSRDGKHTFTIAVLSQIQKDSKPYVIDWNIPAAFSAEINEIYDAAIFTYAPGLPHDPNCLTSGNCVRNNFGDQALIGINPLGLYLWVDNSNASQVPASTFTRIDEYLVKTLPFSLAPPLLKLDAEGPIAHAGLLGTSKAACDIKMGANFKDFLSTCVENSGDMAADTTEYNKLLGGISHDDEHYFFDVQGIDINFAAGNLPPNDVIHDKDVPGPTDVSAEFDVDQNLLGVIANDHIGNDGTQAMDLHGSGLVYLEYARLIQDALSASLPQGSKTYALGAPECTSQVVDGQYPDGCTGFEGFITAAPTGSPGFAANALGVGATTVDPNLALGLKCGHPYIDFCTDINATGDTTTGYQNCVEGDLFMGAFIRAQAVFGKGKLANLPTDMQDVRFFWKQYVTALLKYFVVANNNPTSDDVYNAVIDENNLFFDSVGAGQFEIAEFVDRQYTSATVSPIDIQLTADVRDGIYDEYTFVQGLYRGEKALYTGMLNPTLALANPPAEPLIVGAQDTATLTNMFGSPVLATGWKTATTGKSAYYCATNNDPQHCDGQLPPLAADGVTLLTNNVGQPILTPYEGAFAGAQTPFTLGQTAITITQTYPDIQSAMVDIPIHLSPYNPKSKLLTPVDVLISWVPAQPGEGFPISLSGTLDKFVETSSIDFSGTTITANVDYAVDPATNALNFLAVETTDFLGDVFLCQDATTGDLLSARMYTPVADILDWFSSHPTAYSDCGIIIRYSPYGNFADYITSITNGVRLGITQGGGFGRVVDATLFVPGQ